MNAKGFTLLEIVVVVGILGVLVGAGVGAMVPFKERREILSDARNMASLIKQTQVKASAVEIPTSCNSVVEYELTYSDSSVTLSAISPDLVTCHSIAGVLVFQSGAEFVTAGEVVFSTPFGSTSSSTVSICKNGIQYDLEVGENGSVSEPLKSVTPGC